MKNIYFICFFVGLFGLSYESCFRQLFETDFCTSPNGITIPLNGDLKIADRCLGCTCSTYTPGKIIMTCCGYGIHAGIMVPPPGCKIITEADGCTPKLVLLADESKLCTHK